MTSGRNQPCPCGSGKKFKKCCGMQPVTGPIESMHGLDTDKAAQIAFSYHQKGYLQQAAAGYQRILQVEPNNAYVLHNLGMIAHQNKNNDYALKLIRKALAIKPAESIFHNSLGKVMYSQFRLSEAVECFRKALLLRPDFEGAYNNLGVALGTQGLSHEAIECYKKVLEFNPANMPAHVNMALALQAIGQVEEAIEWHEKALVLAPGSVAAHDNFLLAMNYSYRCTQERIYREHLKYSALHSNPESAHIKHRNSRDPERRLRVGYLSPDFRAHSVAFFMEPVLECHNHEQFEVFAYYNNNLADHVTKRLEKYFDHWRSIAALSDENVAEIISKDQIDILVDLAGHTENNRLLVFARKPAPLQVTWLGYPGTTGLAEMDYRISDNYADPAGETERYHTEKLLRLPETFSCFQAPEKTPAVSDLPAQSNGYITFCSFNNLAKINPEVMKLWAEILKQVPDSRLMLKYKGLGEELTRQSVRKVFSETGIPAERLILLGYDAVQNEHLLHYQHVDIALDTFPYNGTTTTCDALWMGVPVITLEGRSHAARVGVSQLNNLGFSEFIASDKKQYIAIARELASDLEHLSALRSTLRQKMSRSPLMNKSAFTHNLESAYRDIWKQWCKVTASDL